MGFILIFKDKISYDYTELETSVPARTLKLKQHGPRLAQVSIQGLDVECCKATNTVKSQKRRNGPPVNATGAKKIYLKIKKIYKKLFKNHNAHEYYI